MAKRRASQELTAAVVPDDGSEQTEVRLTPLGAGQEVGRSCIILEHGYAPLHALWGPSSAFCLGAAHMVTQLLIGQHGLVHLAFRCSHQNRCQRELFDVPNPLYRVHAASSFPLHPLMSFSCTRRGKKIMFDCGIHPGLQGSDSLPFLTNEDLDEVSVALITHFHLDHCAAVPYLLAKTNFKASSLIHEPNS